MRRKITILCMFALYVRFMACGIIRPEYKVLESGYESQKEETDENKMRQRFPFLK